MRSAILFAAMVIADAIQQSSGRKWVWSDSAMNVIAVILVIFVAADIIDFIRR